MHLEQVGLSRAFFSDPVRPLPELRQADPWANDSNMEGSTKLVMAKHPITPYLFGLLAHRTNNLKHFPLLSLKQVASMAVDRGFVFPYA